MLHVEILHSLKENIDLRDDLKKLVFKRRSVVLKPRQNVSHSVLPFFYDVTMILMSSPSSLKKMLRI
jgi:hypothetical protein